jgi:class 3 adenylate cyclase
VDTPGDNLLAEFTSVFDTANCAVEIQRELSERNAELPYNRKMEFRIGANLGDVIEEEGRTTVMVSILQPVWNLWLKQGASVFTAGFTIG